MFSCLPYSELASDDALAMNSHVEICIKVELVRLEVSAGAFSSEDILFKLAGLVDLSGRANRFFTLTGDSVLLTCCLLTCFDAAGMLGVLKLMWVSGLCSNFVGVLTALLPANFALRCKPGIPDREVCLFKT